MHPILYFFNFRTGLQPPSVLIIGNNQNAIKYGEFTEIFTQVIRNSTSFPFVIALKRFRFNPTDFDRQDQANTMLASASSTFMSHDSLCPMWRIQTPTTDMPSVVMPWYHNGNVLNYVHRNPNVDKFALVQQVVQGLAYIHGMGAVHGNFNPRNVMIADDGSARINDIGLNLILRRVVHNDRVKVPDSWMYKPPEELFPQDDILEPTMAMDVYALASTIYTIYTSKVPYSGWQCIRGLSQIRDGGHGQLERPGEIPIPLWNVLQWCWAYVPGRRPSAIMVEQELTSMRPLTDPFFPRIF